jgi:carbamoyl-phosphate synthase large subunit
MKNILLTCAGGPAAIGVIKSLRDIDFKGKIVTIDSDPLAAGGFLSDSNYIVPLSDDPSYWETVAGIIEDERINLILPTGDMDIIHFANHKEVLEAVGIVVFMSDVETIDICQNKELFYKKCKQDFPLPFTTTDVNDFNRHPFFEEKHKIIGKPKRGSGSRGIEFFKSYYDAHQHVSLQPSFIIDDAHQTKKNYSDYIFQSHLPGKEYTVDLLSDLDGKVLVCVVRERLQVKAGISVKGKIIRDENIEKLCTDLALHLNLKGPVCIQLKEDENGNPKFIEVNPRLGGGTYFTTLAGVNFMDIIVNKRLDIPEPKEITVVRYFNEIIV